MASKVRALPSNGSWEDKALVPSEPWLIRRLDNGDLEIFAACSGLVDGVVIAIIPRHWEPDAQLSIARAVKALPYVVDALVEVPHEIDVPKFDSTCHAASTIRQSDCPRCQRALKFYKARKEIGLSKDS